jgi:hypothetical protein
MNTQTKPEPSKTPAPLLHAIDRVLYPITLGYTFVIFAFMVYEFWMGGLYRPRLPFADVYLTLLTAYAAQREGTKWLGAEEPATRLRRGELFVALWFATLCAGAHKSAYVTPALM